ncbi:MAG: arsenic efflux protein, partial [Actinobacteria bacterium]|nr:arsenic efflux protein [Actinomycetota bacterium]
GKAGPAIGALLGTIPQCGISVMGTALYTQRLITIGTLMAVYLSTSDEAIPVILSQPDKFGVIVPLVISKLIIALVVGYSLDLMLVKQRKATLAHIDALAGGHDDIGHHHDDVLEGPACCGHTPGAAIKTFMAKRFFVHPLIHTLKVFVFIFLVSLAINVLIGTIGEEAFAGLLAGHTILQPVLAALVGLIPNCAASVAITELYLEGAITFGAVIAGLCASGGLGVLVLFKEAENKKEALKIIALLFVISVVAGLIAGVLVS